MTSATGSIRVTSPTLHLTIWFSVATFVTIVVMAVIFKVEVVASGTGKVVPISRVQVVQPEFDGKIAAIYVDNGSSVKQGDVLIELDTIDADVDVNTITDELERLAIEHSRISVLLEGIDKYNLESDVFRTGVMSSFSLTDHSTHPSFSEHYRLLGAEIDDLQAALQRIATQIDTNTKSVSVIKARIARVNAAYSIQRERLEMVQGLLQGGTVSRSDHLNLIETSTALEKEKEIYRRELNQKITEESVFTAERRTIVSSQRNRLLQRRTEILARRATLEEQLQTARRRVSAAQLTAPMDGTVNQLEVYTIGGVAKSGEELLQIVPLDQDVEFVATFSNQDIGFLIINQQANIKLDAYPAERFGYITGHVSNLAADAIETSEGQWAYTVRIAPDTDFLESGGNRYGLRAGMTAAIDITTDNRRIISYFFAPIVETIQNAMGER